MTFITMLRPFHRVYGIKAKTNSITKLIATIHSKQVIIPELNWSVLNNLPNSSIHDMKLV